MEAQLRLVELRRLLEALQPVSAERLMHELEVSRATLMRGIADLRDRLNFPIVYDADRKGYRLDDAPRYGPRYEMPGLWLRVEEVYGLLTLLNVLVEIDPGLLQPYVSPLRGLLKKILSEKEFPLQAFNRKIAIELGNVPKPKKEVYSMVSAALSQERRLQLTIDQNGEEDRGEYSPQRFVLKADGWHLDAILHPQGLARIPMTLIKTAQILDQPAEQASEILDAAPDPKTVLRKWMYGRHDK
ncbi:MAG TPA: HTH domain-containing protein [Burkholderiales bacterium]|nr:HTH domain-containing protein [Burkholderiales bacterium]